MTTMDRQVATEGAIRLIGLLVDRAGPVVRVVAQPSLVQLIMRFALAVPFWRSRDSQVGWLSPIERHRGHVVHG